KPDCGSLLDSAYDAFELRRGSKAASNCVTASSADAGSSLRIATFMLLAMAAWTASCRDSGFFGRVSGGTAGAVGLAGWPGAGGGGALCARTIPEPGAPPRIPRTRMDVSASVVSV